MTSENHTNLEFSDLIDEISLSGKTLSPADLHRWIEKYPEFERELHEYVRFEITLKHSSENNFVESPESSSENRRKIRNIVQNASLNANISAQNNLESFASKAKEKGMKFPQLAQKLGLSLPLLANLEQRFVKYQSVPEQIVIKISETLDVAVDKVRNYLQMPPALSTQGSFKSTDKPEIAEQEDFFTLVERDRMLSPSQKEDLLKLKK